MRLAVAGLLLRPSEGHARLAELAAERLGIPRDSVLGWKILRRSLDARGRREPRFECTVGVEVRSSCLPPNVPGVVPWRGASWTLRPPSELPRLPPVVVGAGPAGLFAALRLCEYGFRPVVLERGKPVEERVRDVAAYWKSGELDPESNVQFGEGGAGTFSDGKLTYRGKDFRKVWVFERLIRAGAPDSILWDAKPHLGTDRLRAILRQLRSALAAAGAAVQFRARVERLWLTDATLRGVETAAGPTAASAVFLAAGHSARDLYVSLDGQGAGLEAKGFALGVRVEVLQDELDRCQYGPWAGEPGLPRADFVLKTRSDSGRDVYSFCMCPGGVVIPAGTEPEGLAVNGMSASGRTGRHANAALVTPVAPRETGGSGRALEGLRFQRQWEERCWRAGGKAGLPAQTVGDFLADVVSRDLPRSSSPWRLVPAALDDCLPPFVAAALRGALPVLVRQLPPLGKGVLLGLESRTSSPVRIPRGPEMESLTLRGLYPVGEGSGYAGGIVSAAVDGARAADAWASRLGGGVEEAGEEEEAS